MGIRRTQVLTQAALLDHAIQRSTPLQAERLTNVTGLGWTVEKCATHRGKSAVFIRHHNGVIGAVLPCGTLKRAPVGQKTLRIDLAKL